jgi:hypothetical protein
MRKFVCTGIVIALLIGCKKEGVMTRKITKLNGEYYSVVKDSQSDTGDPKVSYYGRNVYGFKYTGNAFTSALSRFVEYHGDLKPTKRTLAVSAKNTKQTLGYLVQFKTN